MLCKDSSVKVSVTEPDIFGHYRFVPAAMFDNTYVAVSNRHVHHAVSLDRSALVISLPFNLFHPDGDAIREMFRSGSSSIRQQLAGFCRNPANPSLDSAIRIQIAPISLILDDLNFVPAPLYFNVMLKATPTMTSIAAIDRDQVSLIEIPSGLMYPRLINCLEN